MGRTEKRERREKEDGRRGESPRPFLSLLPSPVSPSSTAPWAHDTGVPAAPEPPRDASMPPPRYFFATAFAGAGSSQVNGTEVFSSLILLKSSSAPGTEMTAEPSPRRS
ncbi:MAG: hypothetical protein B7X11_05840 [Acidobacteria bacterium 37-65-4]|nr:MAG: hypothetical protein B7X11_05840 [Acidobacteria bacterium 37-65-4]